MEPLHVELGGRLVPFAGWNMPVMYKSILEEHSAVRNSVGIFDISHMGQIMADGPGALAWLDGLLTNHVAKLEIGDGQYTFLLNDAGGVIDDLLVYRLAEESFFLVVNASKVEEDFAWLSARLGERVELTNASAEWAGMAVQGPRAPEVFATVFPGESLPSRNRLRRMENGALVGRTGYTGEDGFEYFCPTDQGMEMFRKFLAGGATPCGLGARDSLRLEMCYPLNGNDLMPTRTPLEAGLGFFVSLDKGDFIGREALVRQKREGLTERLVALECTGPGAPPRAHYPVLDAAGRPAGELSSGMLSPSLGKGIGMAYVPIALAKVGTAMQIDVRGRRVPAAVAKKPFYKHDKTSA